jgi:hypothetical protein
VSHYIQHAWGAILKLIAPWSTHKVQPFVRLHITQVSDATEADTILTLICALAGDDSQTNSLSGASPCASGLYPVSTHRVCQHNLPGPSNVYASPTVPNPFSPSHPFSPCQRMTFLPAFNGSASQILYSRIPNLARSSRHCESSKALSKGPRMTSGYQASKCFAYDRLES